jgi:glycolate oxidase iron-sulfur subunit
METHLTAEVRDSPEGLEAESIVRSCVHCGFCLATCPTYQLLGDELDSPRGRIYLVKRALEGGPVTDKTQRHLDRCLTCRNCETTCPSGVEYGRLLDIGRRFVDARVPRRGIDALKRRTMRATIPNARVFALFAKAGQFGRAFLPASLADKLPKAAPAGKRPAPRHARRMLVLEGCVQPALAPSINAAASRILDRLGISLVAEPRAGCCGALSFHLDAQEEAREFMRRNIDAWWPHVESGVEAIVMTASGCGVTVKDYGRHLRTDARYAAKAARISDLTRDISEVLISERAGLPQLFRSVPRFPVARPRRISFHAPCTLQHGQKIRGVVEDLLGVAGFNLVPVPEAHLCCGSAGAYSLLFPEIAEELRDRKLAHLQAGAPEVIATANIGCLTHLQAGTKMPVRHWIELLDSVSA